MSNKHFVNDPVHLVNLALRSAPLTNPSLALDEENKIVYCKSSPESQAGRVAIVSGGGAGHEPSFVSFVGDGVLRAAVSGSIFASPSVKQIYSCITRRVNPNSGVLLIVMNYTGDILHFGLASEKAKAAGVDVDMVVVADDVGVGREKNGKVGRRGIAGTVLVHKIAGALAAATPGTASLKEVSALATLVAANLVSVGSSLAHVHVPGRVIASDGDEEGSLKPDEIEIGMGIHNEQGCKRVKIPELPELVGMLLDQLLSKEDKDRNYLEDVENVEGWVLMLNNLGGVSPLEMGAITTEAVKQLDSTYSIKPTRVFAGTFMTSLNGNGFSISLLRLVDTGLGKGKSMLDLLDAPHESLGWSAPVKQETWASKDIQTQSSDSDAKEESIPPSGLKLNVDKFSHTLSASLQSLIKAEPEISRYDEQVGDGDCGSALKKGAEAILQLINTNKIHPDAVITISTLAEVVEENMDGTSGAIYSIFLNSLAKALREAGEGEASLGVWAKAAMAALVSLRKYTPAQPGDRTLVDALQPCIISLAEHGDVSKAAKAAREGAESTRGMKASLGRSVYVGELGDTPDPGAIGIAVFMEGLAGAV
ncbi:dihydroxyacetone kinase [Choiromyces venosus 120613-1]|uniref:Dihydroxyacetone kinase n=1 Tax=Choiromyces venosus 120613-1 TaxID=1336337 RepID=A0A3N4JE26_9PEZI|nr:dihydroxyacetone kinase [Choiromyces venosus 120613-1]